MAAIADPRGKIEKKEKRGPKHALRHIVEKKKRGDCQAGKGLKDPRGHTGKAGRGGGRVKIVNGPAQTESSQKSRG